LLGKQNYTAEIGRLANPHNDIALLERVLKDLQSEVYSVRDGGFATLHHAVSSYVRRLRNAGQNAVAFFYFSGHGADEAGARHLIPIDVRPSDVEELWAALLRLTEVTRKLKAEAGNATHFIVFDACRNNSKLRKPGSRALVQARGFVPMLQETGMLVAYATAEGELASDLGSGAGRVWSVCSNRTGNRLLVRAVGGLPFASIWRSTARRGCAATQQHVDDGPDRYEVAPRHDPKRWSVADCGAVRFFLP